ncbi:hypothetical protein, partial [Alistipes sp. CHKCI003]|uniref:hypothetical protein n=1 Tax=Alistipes sp. CHKCI003 TaxID=1780376 RepID=UPI001C0CF21F
MTKGYCTSEVLPNTVAPSSGNSFNDTQYRLYNSCGQPETAHRSNTRLYITAFDVFQTAQLVEYIL